MKVGNSADEVGKRVGERIAGWLREPITQGLLFSLALHLTIAVLFQPAPGSGVRQTVIINARLQTASPKVEPAPATPEVAATEMTTETHAAKTLLTATTPSPAPPIPQTAPVPESVVTPNIPPPQPVVSAPVAATATTELTPAAKPAEPSRGGPQTTGLPSLPLDIDTNWYSARQVDVHPKAIGLIEPVYPEEAKQRDVEGSLKLMLKIDDLGRVQSAEVVEATPPGVFDEAALTAFRNAHFRPAMKDGRPVRYQAYMRVEFKLKD